MGQRQFVTFRLYDRLMGIDILEVREVNRALDITPVQHAPAYIRGLVNLRGRIITVFDLRTRLGLSPGSITGGSHNIILKKDDIGLLVDGIGDVEGVDDERIKGRPANLDQMGLEFVECVAELRSELLVILSPDRILELPRKKGGLT